MKINYICRGKLLAVVLLVIGSLIIPSNIVLSNENSVIKNSTIENQSTEYWALLIAVGIYADNPEQNRPLMLEEGDDLYEMLLTSDVWSEDHIKLIKGADATPSNIISGFRWLDSMEDAEDISLVFITTHGSPLGYDIPPRDEEDNTDEILSTYWSFAYKGFALWDDQLNVLLNRLESKGVCFIVDSCYAGGFNDDPNWNKLSRYISPNLYNHIKMTAKEWIEGFGKEVSGQNRVVLMASCEDEVSYSGGFAPYIIDGLRGYADSNSDNIVTAEEAFYYTEPRTWRQSPTIYDLYPGELPIMYLSDLIDNSENNKILNNEKNDMPVVSLNSQENSIIKGFITGEDTGSPVINASVSIRGRDNNWDFFENETTTDSNGFYSINIPECRISITAYADGYCGRQGGPFEIDENEIFWVNFSMKPRPPEISVINGFITDKETGNPIINAKIDLHWEGDENQYYSNDTMSDNTGYYKMNIAPGEVDLDVRDNNYFPESINHIYVSEDETLWFDFELFARPAETAVVCGYITDGKTGNPINNVRVELLWIDHELEQDYENETSTDSSGFYSINIAPGEIYNDIRKQGYDYYNPYRLDAQENKNLWMNITLEQSENIVDIVKPLKAIYFNNNRVFPFSNARIIGNIDIEADVNRNHYGQGGSAEKVEIYIDGELKSTITQEPFTWSWTEKTFGKHTIKVIAYDYDGSSVSKEIEVYKFL